MSDISQYVSKIFIKEVIPKFENDEKVQILYETMLKNLQKYDYDISNNVDKVLLEARVVKFIKDYDKSKLTKL